MCGELKPRAARRAQGCPAQPRSGSALVRSGLAMCGLCHVLLPGVMPAALLAVTILWICGACMIRLPTRIA